MATIKMHVDFLTFAKKAIDSPVKPASAILTINGIIEIFSQLIKNLLF